MYRRCVCVRPSVYVQQIRVTAYHITSHHITPHDDTMCAHRPRGAGTTLVLYLAVPYTVYGVLTCTRDDTYVRMHVLFSVGAGEEYY